MYVIHTYTVYVNYGQVLPIRLSVGHTGGSPVNIDSHRVPPPLVAPDLPGPQPLTIQQHRTVHAGLHERGVARGLPGGEGEGEGEGEGCG